MNEELIFRVVLGMMLAAMGIIRQYYEALMRRTLKTSTIQTRETTISNLIPSTLLILGTLGAWVYTLVPRWMIWSALALPPWLRWTGAAFSVGGVLLLGRTHMTLGRNFVGGATLHQEHQLITAGPYRWTRHPMYTAFFLLMVGYFLLSANWFVGLMWLGLVIWVVAWRLDKEEGLLLEKFGDDYRAYMQRTGRFLPRL